MKPKRYSDKEKSHILRSIAAYNALNGKGGIANAVKKFSVSPITLNKWLEASKSGKKPAKASPAKETAPKDRPASPRRSKRRKPAPKPVKIERRKARIKKSARVLAGSLRQKLNNSLSKIEALEREIAQRQSAIDKEKQAIKKLLV